MPATAAAAFAAPAVKSRGEDDVALFDGEVGFGLGRRRGFVGHDGGRLERDKRPRKASPPKKGAIKKKRARGWGNHGPKERLSK